MFFPLHVIRQEQILSDEPQEFHHQVREVVMLQRTSDVNDMVVPVF